MSKKMLIDAAHPEEVRVALLSQNKIEDFDFESESKKPLRGNIYLARVTRVEPSLQAAFVDYGGNRHGFLAFSEIHPDYYQIPVADRDALQEVEAEVAALALEVENAQRALEDADSHGDVSENDDDNNDDNDDDNDNEVDDHESDDDIAEASSDDNDEALTEDTINEERVSDEQDDEIANEASSDTDFDDPATYDPDEDDDSHFHADDDDDDSDLKREEEEEEEEEKEEEKPSDPSALEKVDAKKDNNDDEENGAEDSAQAEEADESVIEDVDAELEALGHDDQPSHEAQDDSADDVVSESDDVDNVDADDEQEIDESVDDETQEDETLTEGNKSVASRKVAAKAYEAALDKYKDAKRKRANLIRNYKIQEVIKRRQILLIQVVKEERGNKGAALTTYMSLAGRYCVLMPNTARGGGISRKIAQNNDRRRLRRVVDSLEVPQGMGLIIRTAGAKRTKTEIKRDYDYLLRLWENIRSLTLKSIAPCLIYEEASLIKRAIRDMYDKDISKVLVDGEAGYREAKDFMKMLMPSHAKNVQPYKEQAPIFLKYGVETQLDNMYNPSVRLKSGGYIVIHQTEALVAIDVNSGRATRERNIEQTALKTNIEAAEEAARQFRLRDLAGLIVIDFIDMEETRNNRKVEKALKEALKTDRARIQVGRISTFGLLEMSRQRRRSGIVDGTTQVCPTCAGAGVIRSDEVAAMRILRGIEGEAISGKHGKISIRSSTSVTMHTLNHHRDWIGRIERENGVGIEIIADPKKFGDDYEIEKSGVPREVADDRVFVRADQTEPVEIDEPEETDVEQEAAEDGDADAKPTGRKRRRRRRGRRSEEAQDASSDDKDTPQTDEDNETDANAQAETSGDEKSDDEQPKKRRRRGRRGGRRNRRDAKPTDEATDETAEQSSSIQTEATPSDENANIQETPPKDDVVAPEPVIASVSAVLPEPKNVSLAQENPSDEGVSADDVQPSSPAPTPLDETSTKDVPADAPIENGAAEKATEETASEPKPSRPAKKGWWQKAIRG